MTDKQHRELAEVLRNVEGKVALSSYHCQLMDQLYGDWRRIESKEKVIHSVKAVRQEVLWINYELEGKAEGESSARFYRIRMQLLEAY